MSLLVPVVMAMFPRHSTVKYVGRVRAISPKYEGHRRKDRFCAKRRGTYYRRSLFNEPPTAYC